MKEALRSVVPVLGFCLINLVTGPVYGQTATESADSAKPKVYALIGAVGAQFSVVHSVPSVGSHLNPTDAAASNYRITFSIGSRCTAWTRRSRISIPKASGFT